MDRKIRVGAVSYLNTKPLIFGFQNGLMKDEIELFFDYPSKIAAQLLNDEIDIGLVPVAIIPEMKEHYIVSDYCIGTEGAVESVCLFSEVPIEQIEIVLLDYQSRTSVALAKILMREFWKITPQIVQATDGFIDQIKGATAAVVIGDRALSQRKVSPYIYDLGLAWKEFTGLPFVFAAWVSNKPLSAAFIKEFNKANDFGLQRIDKVISNIDYDPTILKLYYTQLISYQLDEAKKNGLAHFFNYLKREITL